MITRIITGVIGIALAAFIIQTGGTLFAGFALVLSLVAWFEYARAFSERGMALTMVTGFLGLALLWYAGWQGNAELMVAASALIVLVVLLGLSLALGAGLPGTGLRSRRACPPVAT